MAHDGHPYEATRGHTTVWLAVAACSKRIARYVARGTRFDMDRWRFGCQRALDFITEPDMIELQVATSWYIFEL